VFKVFAVPSAHDLERPRFWRYWDALPGVGEMSIYTGLFAVGSIGARVVGAITDAELARRLRHLLLFEKNIVANGGG
jgi:polyphosphate kinase 2 (PPK2 family)